MYKMRKKQDIEWRSHFHYNPKAAGLLGKNYGILKQKIKLAVTLPLPGGLKYCPMMSYISMINKNKPVATKSYMKMQKPV